MRISMLRSLMVTFICASLGAAPARADSLAPRHDGVRSHTSPSTTTSMPGSRSPAPQAASHPASRSPTT